MFESNRWLNDVVLLMPTWKWFGLIILFGLGTLFYTILKWLLGEAKNLKGLFPSGEGFWHYYTQLHIESPLAWVLLSLLWFFGLEALDLPPRLDKYFEIFVKLVLSYNAIKLSYIAIDALGSLMANIVSKTSRSLDDHLIPFAVKTLKAFVVLFGILLMLQSLGVNVLSLLAGLGLGGLALALAAQDAAGNLIGTIVIILDRPFSIGDWIKIGDVEGTIESIGFRSTRIRTFYNSLIAIPNSTVAKEKIDNMGLRAYRRVRQNLGIHYDTPTATLEHFCHSLKEWIGQDSAVVRDSIVVVFNNFGDSALNVQMTFHLNVATSDEENTHQQAIFYGIIDLAKQLQIQFAYPTQTVYYHHDEATGFTSPA